MSKHNDASHAVYEGGSLRDHSYRDRTERHVLQRETEGHVKTADGIVLVASTAWRQSHVDPWTYATSLYFIYAGREHSRRFTRAYSKRYLVTLAKRFASDVVESIGLGE